ncbi:G-protein coupled receptor 182 [Brachyhypopomus gauderio]|uniref:G-protein coupled receptor 182 n=1 Tax=Brachyhypopomus gauderio TaxID=698409 RepID=UPI0040433F93
MTHEPNATDYHHDLWFYDCTFDIDRNPQRVALFLLYLLLFMVGLAENILVLWVNWRRRHGASGVLFCIINISLSDLMVVIVMPFYMLEISLDQAWLWGRFLCKVTHLVYVMNFYSSSFFLALMTLERYLLVARPTVAPLCFPVQPRQRRWLACSAVWILSLVLALLENVHVDLLEWSQPGCYMIPQQYHTEWFITVTVLGLLFQFVVPAAVIVTCNALIARAARVSPEVRSRRDLWLVHVYSLVFVTCWLPYHLVAFLLMVDDLVPHLLSCNLVEVLYFSFNVVQGISLVHCIANPILYNFLSRSFRANLASDVVARLAPPPANATQANGADGAGAQTGKPRTLSNTSTSHSDLGS